MSDQISVHGRRENETQEQYKARKKQADKNRQALETPTPITSVSAPTRKQRRRNGYTIEGGNTPFIRTGRVKLSKKEKKQYKKQRMRFKKNSNKV